jgi:hypothetical protein
MKTHIFQLKKIDNFQRNLNTILHTVKPQKHNGHHNDSWINRRCFNYKRSVSSVNQGLENKINQGHLHRNVRANFYWSIRLVYLRNVPQ